MLFYPFILSVICEGALQVGLITTSYTDASTINLLSSNLFGVTKQVENILDLNTEIQIVWVKIDLISDPDETQWTIPSLFQDNLIQVFLDAGNFVQYSNFLASLALENNLLHVVVGRPQNTLEDETTSRNTLFAETTFISQAYAVYDLIKKWWGWC